MKLMRIKNACRDIISITPFKNNKMIAISAHFFFIYIVLILYKKTMFIDALPVLLSEAVRFRYQRKLLFEKACIFL